ncbi:hypothetical protein ACIQW9_05075 [Herminiimonas sp. NPDC097707]|uniref:hypothetical protein n=1 Tax=Herminiimonas sp. NPDC097707 TaxID=3364007 RepID=UPI00383AF801
MKKILIGLMGWTVVGMACATLPPLSDEAKAKAAEAKNKTDWSNKVAAYQLCQVQDRVAANYLKSKGKPKPAGEFPACTSPGPYVALQVATSTVGVADAKPVPAAGAKK